MRRESSTVVALVGDVAGDLLAGLGRSPNVAVARAPATASAAGGSGAPPARPGWELGALAMREAARRRSMYVIAADDPLAEVAASWQQMWDLSAGSPGSAGFEASAADALAAWRDKRFELPDYYLVIAPAQAAATGSCPRVSAADDNCALGAADPGGTLAGQATASSASSLRGSPGAGHRPAPTPAVCRARARHARCQPDRR
jgi:hypothetical protein